MPTVTAPEVRTYTVEAGQVLTVAASAVSSGTVLRLSDSVGEGALLVSALALGESRTFGPFGVQTRWEVRPSTGVLAITVGAAEVATLTSALRVAHAKYDFAVHGGAQGTIAPVNSDTIPDNAILIGATINSTTAVTSDGSATVAVGTSAGSSTTSIKGATGKASYSADAMLNGVPVLATPVKLTAAGTITFTIGAADLTAGVVEVWVYYVVAAA